ncbi:ABC transporter substrate-binding protein [Desulfoferula mesophila]|uniref:Peptide ABC transporter substrate-binding protein n=1 Tax=Desulfoferula mesophila TaxID=3058419 RepID=A0AAU9F2M2_9BACT|nr:peptide ABC transporter substrate-binding protein [Desulfoferula mesophilus]
MSGIKTKFKKAGLALTVLTLALALALPGLAADKPKFGGSITVGLNTDLTAVDPHTSVAVVNAIVLHHVFEPLLAYGEDLKLMPVACESWEANKDYTAYTFHLRKNKLFHNGREMVAADVKFSLDRVMDPKISPRAKHFTGVASVEAVDKYTVVVKLKKPFAAFPHLLAYINPVIAIVPQEELAKQGGVFKEKPVGTGPYMFSEWKPDRYIILKKFDKYTGPTGPRSGLGGERVAYLDTIKLVPIPEESVSIMALLNKEIDLLQYYPPKYVEKYQKDYAKKGLVLNEVPGLSWYQVYFGVNRPVTNNVKFRQACAYAIDLDKVTQAAYLGHAKSNPSVIARGSIYRTPAHDTWYKYDPAKAKQLLKESGYKGETVVLDTTKKYIAMFRQAVAVQAAMQAVGINVKLNVVEWPVLLKKCVSGDFQMLSYGAGGTPNPALAYAYLKRGGFEDAYPEIKKIKEAALMTDDLKTLQGLYEKAHRITYEQVPWIQLYNYNYLQAHWNYVKGYKTINTGYPILWGVWLDK